DEQNLEIQAVDAYKLSQKDHHEEKHSSHPADESANVEKQPN
ncbi:hypothetical protein Tco_0587318, partial [Tanacetum coccineum]